MRAIVIREGGALELATVPDPAPSRHEARVRVRATAVNRADLLQRRGLYPAPPDAPRDIPGLEIAGEVDAIGEGVTNVAVGDRVFGVVGGGGYAEAIAVHERALAPMPKGMSFTDAAAIPEAFLTAYDAMITQAALAPGESVLVHAAGSGVGTAAVQIARATGARSIGTSRTKAKLDRVKELGLGDGIVCEGASFAKEVMRLTSGRGVDVVLDLVGGAYVAEDLACVAMRGRVVVVGLLAGARADVDLGLLMRRRASVIGTVLRSRPVEEKLAAARVLAGNLVPLFESGALRPVVEEVFSLAEADVAHAKISSRESFGKVVLRM